jgi:hypothetical protein
MTPLEVLDELDYLRSDFICEPDRIRVVRSPEGHRFWRSWWEDGKKK